MPNIILDSVRGPQTVPIDDMFLKDRKIFLVGEVNDASCNDLIKQLLYSVEDVSNVTMCDSYFDAEEAIEFGIASKVIDSECLGELMKRNAA